MQISYLIVILVVILFFTIKIIQPKKAWAVLFLGKPQRVMREWLNFMIPIIEQVVLQSLAMFNLNVKVDGITKDNVKTTVEINVIYSVKEDDQSVIDSLFKNSNVVQTIKSLVEEQLRAKIFEFSHEEIFGKRNEIWDEIKQILTAKLAQFGMELDSVQVVDIQLDKEVVDAMNRVVSSIKNKTAKITEAEANKQSQILAAEADREVKRLLGEGMAAQREAIAKWFKEAVDQIKWSDNTLQGKQILDFLLDSNRIEILEKVWTNGWNSKIIYLNENLEAKKADMIKS